MDEGKDNRRLLLISNSTLHGSGYLDHCEPMIRDFMGKNKRILFVPYARPSGMTHDDYAKKAYERFDKMGIRLDSIHQCDSTSYRAVRNAEAIFIGGGNTFVLLNSLQKSGIVGDIAERIREGMPYIGTSAGANVAGKTIMTTNDMPIAYPESFDAMGAVPFIINPHYIDPVPDSKHMGESRETRIREYHVFNSDPVVALREGAMLRVEGDKMELAGTTNARLFMQDQEAIEYAPGSDLSFLL
ncbi:MAG: dipeptidase PepE [Nanoarchaeota archaeon]